MFCWLQVAPSFCKTYARVGDVIQQALNEYKREVSDGEFPGSAFAPYKLQAAEKDKFDAWAKQQLEQTQREEAAGGKEKTNKDEASNETIKVY